VQALLLVPVVGAYAWHAIREYRAGRRPNHDFWIASLGTIISSLLLFNQARYAGIEAKIVAVLGLHLTQFLAAAIVIGLGWVAYLFKRSNKLWYGMVEMFFGASSAIAIVTSVNFTAVEFSKLSLAQFAALAGSAYIVARGLNNYHDAKHPNTRVR